MITGGTYDVEDMGVFTPKAEPRDTLSVGEDGFVIANIKKISDCQIGDTLTDDKIQTTQPFPGFREIKPMVFAGLYPIDSAQYEDLRDAMEKLRLNDSSFNYEPEASGALGFGFRCGFLGLLHMEIVQERLERVQSRAITRRRAFRIASRRRRARSSEVHNPSKLPRRPTSSIEEPIITAMIITPPSISGTS
jgi:GTP-binding protein LepA